MDDQSVISLRENHAYVHQIQGQMYLTGTTTCFFVVYTNNEIEFCVVELAKDDSWSENIDSLVQFYVDFMLPHMTGSSQPDSVTC